MTPEPETPHFPKPARRRVFPLLVALAALVLAAAPAFAHGVGMSTVQLHSEGSRFLGEWDLNLRDARMAIGLDTQVKGEDGWNDLRQHDAQLRALMLRSLTITADGRPCTIAITPAPTEWDPKFDNVRMHVVVNCAAPPKVLGIRDELLFDLDKSHRAYFSVEDERVTSIGTLHANDRSATFQVHQFHALEVMGEFIREGTWHIWTGLDHMLFLLALLLPATLVRTGQTWTPRIGLRPATGEVVKVVSAFTVAHSLTLCLSFFGITRPPSQWVEVGIALSVFAAAWNNLRPFLPGRAWLMAFGFGLVHGLGFAGALTNLSLPRHARLLALGMFNVGVELGQLTLVVIAMPLLYLASRRAWYPRFVMGLGSLGIAWLAIVWVLQRAFGLALFTHH